MYKDFMPDRNGRASAREEFIGKHPDKLCGILAKSILGKDIDYFKIGSGKRAVLAVGAHHGSEHITASALYDFLFYIAECSDTGASLSGINISFLLQKFTFFIIPCLNPDGVDMAISGISKTPLYDRQLKMNGGSLDFSLWQANARGVDLNHNYNAGFFEYKKMEASEGIIPGPTRYSGEFPESEPETKALASFVRTVAPEAVVSLHSQGGEIFSKPRGERVDKIAAALAKISGYKTALATGHAAYGGLSDYTGDVLGIPSFTVEVGTGENPIPRKQLFPICERVRKILVTLPTLL